MDPTEQFIRSRYSFIDQTSILMPTIYDQADQYLPVSCLLISGICRAGMLATDALSDPSNSVPVSLLLNNIWQVFWAGYVSFSQLASTSQGSQVITISSPSMALLNTFNSWDEALQPCPFSDAGAAFSTLLQGVSP